MPFKSPKQRAYLHMHHPELAARWEAKYGRPRKRKAKKRKRKR